MPDLGAYAVSWLVPCQVCGEDQPVDSHEEPTECPECGWNGDPDDPRLEVPDGR